MYIFIDYFLLYLKKKKFILINKIYFDICMIKNERE